jgi:hypothetical protein
MSTCAGDRFRICKTRQRKNVDAVRHTRISCPRDHSQQGCAFEDLNCDSQVNGILDALCSVYSMFYMIKDTLYGTKRRSTKVLKVLPDLIYLFYDCLACT